MTRILAALLVSGSVLAGAPGASDPRGHDLVAHEWGTFTSIAGPDGRAVEWLPHGAPTDLPSFVDRGGCRAKGSLPGVIRMETPVIYFYTPREMDVDVRVHFRQGVITEWFPRPAGVPPQATIDDAVQGRIAWSDVHVRPGSTTTPFPVEAAASHYYAARATDAAPLQVGPERERFLFYRGVGREQPPIAATVTPGGHVVVSHTRGEALGDVILVENRGVIRYQTRRTAAARATFEPLDPGLHASPDEALRQLLVSHGLYPKEAAAMVESWRTSWFEPGTRLFYIVSDADVRSMLPLRIDPVPAELTRVFVGRHEIPTADTLREVRAALAHDDGAALDRFGRFLDAFGRQVISSLPAAERPLMERRLDAVLDRSPNACWQAAPADSEG